MQRQNWRLWKTEKREAYSAHPEAQPTCQEVRNSLLLDVGWGLPAKPGCSLCKLLTYTQSLKRLGSCGTFLLVELTHRGANLLKTGFCWKGRGASAGDQLLQL
jgi:hypothetical protein